MNKGREFFVCYVATKPDNSHFTGNSPAFLNPGFEFDFSVIRQWEKLLMQQTGFTGLVITNFIEITDM
jgi:hypothetical protein